MCLPFHFQSGGIQPDILQWVEIGIDSDDECTDDYGNNFDSNSMFCGSAPVSMACTMIGHKSNFIECRVKILVKEIVVDHSPAMTN